MISEEVDKEAELGSALSWVLHKHTRATGRSRPVVLASWMVL